MEGWKWESVEARVACMITRTQKRGRHMDQIVYKPKIKQYECLEMIIFSFFCTVYHLGSVGCGMSFYWRLLWIIPIALLIDILTQRGKMVLDAQGIHAIVPLKGEVAQIPWKAICKCKLYGCGLGYPSVCVMYQNPFTIKFCKELNQDFDGMPLTGYGTKVVCDRDLQKMFLGLEKPEKFVQREVFGCTMTREEYSQVLKWWIAATQQSEEQLGKEDRA